MSSISATRWGTFQRCPLEYRYKYIDRLISKKHKALEIGSLYHEMLELHHSDREEQALRIMEDNKEHSQILSHLYTKYLARPILGTVMETEYEFKVEIPGVRIPLYGFIDRIDEDKGVEYKTASKKWHMKDTETIQTDIYLYVLLKRFGYPVPIVYSVNNKKTNVPPEIITVERTEEEIMQLEDKVKVYLKDVGSSDFAPTPGNHCYLCPWGNHGDGTCIYSK